MSKFRSKDRTLFRYRKSKRKKNLLFKTGRYEVNELGGYVVKKFLSPPN